MSHLRRKHTSGSRRQTKLVEGENDILAPYKECIDGLTQRTGQCGNATITLDPSALPGRRKGRIDIPSVDIEQDFDYAV